MISTDAGAWRWVIEFAYPPFAFLMTLASNLKQPGIGLMLNDCTKVEPTTPKIYEGIAEIGFGWSPYPCDFRSRAKLKTDRQRNRVI